MITPALIVLEGLDGSGKTTLSRLLQAELNRQTETILLQEPTNGPYGLELRRRLGQQTPDPQLANLGLLELFELDRLWDIEHRLQPALASGQSVVLDRYYFSTAAYQSQTAADIDSIIGRFTSQPNALFPDLVLYLEIDPVAALARVSQRNQHHEIFEKEEELRRIEKNYQLIWQRKFTFQVARLDASKSSTELLAEAVAILENL